MLACVPWKTQKYCFKAGLKISIGYITRSRYSTLKKKIQWEFKSIPGRFKSTKYTQTVSKSSIMAQTNNKISKNFFKKSFSTNDEKAPEVALVSRPKDRTGMSLLTSWRIACFFRLRLYKTPTYYFLRQKRERWQATLYMDVVSEQQRLPVLKTFQG